MINHFTFNGTSTAQLGLIVSGVSIFGAGSRKVEKAGIPGRNGDLQIELGGFNNYTVRYTVSITKNFTTTAQQIREWLLESKGYCDLTDTYHPDEIRKACFNSDIEFTTSMLYKYGQASIQFDCLPERYLTTNTPITTTATADTTTDTTMSLSTVPTPINISLNGNTTQEGTPTPSTPQAIHNVSGDNTINVTSKNIAKFEEPYFTANANYTHTDNSINISASGTYARVGYSFKVQTGKQYSISFKAVKSNGSYGLIHVDNNNSWNNSYGGFTLTTSMAEYTKTLTANTDILFIGFYVTSSMTTGTMTVNDFMIEVNSTATTYEPYTRQSYPLYLPVKNLFDRTQVPSSLVSWTYYVPNFGDNAKAYPIYIGKGKTATFKSNIPTLTSGNGFYAINALSEGSTNTLNDTHERTISANNSGYVYVGMITNRQYYQEVIDGTYYIHVTVGNVSNVQDYSIELNKIGTYQDYIYKNGGKWYVHKETASVDMGTLTYQTDNGGVYFYSSVSGKGQTNFDIFCTCYTVTTSTNTSGMTDYQIKGQTSGSYIFIKDSRYTSPTDLKTALSGETLKYNLATATNTEITDTTLINQLNNIEKAYSYNGTTNILQVSNDNGFMLGVVSLHGSTFTSNYKGEPIITVNSTGLIYLNGEVMEVLSAPVTINCQTMQCYNGVVNMNNEVRVNDFPEIKIGANEVGSSMALTITPNNWRH